MAFHMFYFSSDDFLLSSILHSPLRSLEYMQGAKQFSISPGSFQPNRDTHLQRVWVLTVSCLLSCPLLRLMTPQGSQPRGTVASSPDTKLTDQYRLNAAGEYLPLVS